MQPRLPNLVVTGVGHSGTSILTKLLHMAGWERNGCDPQQGEQQDVIEHNLSLIGGEQPERTAADILAGLKTPWCVKDATFIRLMDKWLPAFDPYQPTLVWIVRDTQAVVKSWQKRGARKRVFRGIRGMKAQARQVYRDWPWGRIQLDYQQLRLMAQMFDVHRPQ